MTAPERPTPKAAATGCAACASGPSRSAARWRRVPAPRAASASWPTSPCAPRLTPSDRSPMIRVLLADDQTLVRAGFRSILSDEDDIEVVAEAANGEQAVARARELRPDVVLMDIRMPEL